MSLSRPGALLTCGRIVLLLAHLAGIAVLFLPMALGDWQPIGLVLRVVDLEAWRDGGRMHASCCLPALALLLPAAIWLGQLRAFWPRQAARTAVWLGWGAMLLAMAVSLWVIPLGTSSLLTGSMPDGPWIAALLLALLWSPAVLLGALLFLGRWRRLHRRLWAPALARTLYVGVAIWGLTPALVYGGSLAGGYDLGVYVALGVVAGYALEVLLFLWLGRRPESGRVSSRLLALWLPLGDVYPPSDGLCPACGYDLRGTLQARRTQCPECGLTISAAPSSICDLKSAIGNPPHASSTSNTTTRPGP